MASLSLSVCRIPRYSTADASRCSTRRNLVARAQIKDTPTQSNNAASEKLSGLVDALLGRAASRVKRGTCTCYQCKGEGTCPCPGCKAEGVVEAGHGTARMNMVKHVVSKVEGMLGAKSSGQEWMQTNRCRRCHGVGRLVCVNCHGTGLRYKSSADDTCELPE